MVEGEETPVATPPEDTNPTPPETSGDEGGDKLMAFLSYLGILVIIPLLVKKDDPYVKFHAKQGLTLLVAGVILWVVAMILAFIPIIGWIIAFILWITLIILAIIGIVNALTGKEKPLPLIGRFAEKFKF